MAAQFEEADPLRSLVTAAEWFNKDGKYALSVTQWDDIVRFPSVLPAIRTKRALKTMCNLALARPHCDVALLKEITKLFLVIETGDIPGVPGVSAPDLAELPGREEDDAPVGFQQREQRVVESFGGEEVHGYPARPAGVVHDGVEARVGAYGLDGPDELRGVGALVERVAQQVELAALAHARRQFHRVQELGDQRRELLGVAARANDVDAESEKARGRGVAQAARRARDQDEH